MKKNLLLIFLFVTLIYQSTSAQCPTPTGMLGVPISLSGNCFINIQFAIPNSNVSLYNAGGYVAQGTANASGNVVIAYPCASNPITSITSLTTNPIIQICNTSTITSLIILPIKLVSFSGTLSPQKTVLLKWETSLELNNEKYEVERSLDGNSYTRLATLNSDGSGINNRLYTYEDIFFTAGTTAYYRLKQVDYDGKSSYSKIVYVSDKSSAGSLYSLFPNPLNSSNNNTVQIKGIAASEVTYSNIRITDISGRSVNYKITGANAIEMDAATPGIYLLRIKDQILKLIKN